MPRVQEVVGYGYVPVPTAGTPVPLSATPKFVTSVLIQARSTNGGLMLIGGSADQTIELQANACCKISGDGLDNGTTAFFDLSTIFIDATVSGEEVGFMILDRW